MSSKFIADRTGLIDASGIRKVFALAADLKDPINLSIGQPDFDVPNPVKEAAITAIKEGFNKYTQTTGNKDLLDKIKSEVGKEYSIDNPCALVASGVSGALLLAFMATINPGDEVIIPDPYFVIYKHVINLLGGRCVFVDTYPDFGLCVDKIEDAITDRTKMIIVNSPCNPTGAVYTEQEIKDLAAVADKHGVLVMSDEIYDKFSYDYPADSVGKYYENTLILKGFSKTFAMTGWRMAYAVGSPAIKDVIEEMTKIQQYSFVCAPSPFQKAALAAFDVDITEHVDQYRKKRDIVYEGLKEGFEVVKPHGAIYFFVKAPEGSGGGTEFVKKAIANNVLVIPGNVFSEKDTHFRVGIATSEDKLREGTKVLCELAK